VTVVNIPIAPFNAAVALLATGHGPIKDRLKAAWFEIVSVPETQLPAGDLRQEYMGLLSAVSYREPKRDEGRLAATILRMTEDEAANCALGLLQFWLKLRAAAES
jgi:hypothetical protein